MRLPGRGAAVAGSAAAATAAAALAFTGDLPFRGDAPDPMAPVITDLRATPETIDEGNRVEFLASVDSDDVSALLFHWDFGDGKGSIELPGAAAVRYRFPDGDADATAYAVTLTVTDDARRTARRSVLVRVRNVAPQIQFMRRDGAGLENAPITFLAGAMDAGREDELSFAWDFGDGSAAHGPRVEHRYREPGAHVVRLQVDDGDDGIDERSMTVMVGDGGAFSVAGDVSIPEMELTHAPVVAAAPMGGGCRLRIGLVIDGEASVGLSAVLPRGLARGSYPIGVADQPTVSWADESRSPGTVFAGLDAGMKHDPPERGMFGFASQGGSMDVSYFDGERIELSFTAVLREHTVESASPPPQQAVVSGWISRAVGSSIMRRRSTPGAFYLCDVDPSRRMRVTSIEPAGGDLNVDLEDPFIAVGFDAPIDMSTVHDGTFRLEYRLPDSPEGQPQYQQHSGVVEPLGDIGFRFKPSAPLLSGVYYRATIVGGPEGVRGLGGEVLGMDRMARFGTVVEPEAVRLAVYQVARNAPLIAGKTTATRVYIDWSERPDVHTSAQVLEFPARVDVEVNGRDAYPMKEVMVRRPDRFTTRDSALADNSINFFGWQPGAPGGTSSLTAIVTPVDPEGSGPSEFESAPHRIDHHSGAKRLSFAAFRIRFGSWEEGVPAEAAATISDVLREGRAFTIQNFPIVDFTPRDAMRDLWVTEPALRWSMTNAEGAQVYTNLLRTSYRDDYLAKQAHDMVIGSTDADLITLFFPQEVEPLTTGYAYGFSRRTVGLFIAPAAHAQTVWMLSGTVAHEFGHSVGLVHESACRKGEHQNCLNAGKAGADDIEGFRLRRDGTGGWNKSKTEGNAEAPATNSVLSLMYDVAIGTPVLFMLNEQYEQLLENPLFAMTDPARRDHDDRPPRLAAAGFGAPIGLLRRLAHRSGLTRTRQTPDRSLLVTGVILPDDEAVGLEPLRVVDGPVAVPPAVGPYTLELLDAAGGVLHTASFTPVPFGSDHVTYADGRIESDDGSGEADLASAAASGGWFWVAAPNVDGVHAVRITRDDAELMRLDRSQYPPTVRIDAPSPGLLRAGGTLTLAWSGSDEDDDPIGYVVQYSADGETDWTPITPWSADTRARIELASLGDGPRPTLRVVASDGMRQGTDTLELPASAIGNAEGNSGSSP